MKTNLLAALTLMALGCQEPNVDSTEVLPTPTVEENRNAIIREIRLLAADALHWRNSPFHFYTSEDGNYMAGGDGRTYTGYMLPVFLAETSSAQYVSEALGDGVTFTGSSVFGYGTIRGTFGPDGELSGEFGYTGYFALTGQTYF